MKKGLVAKATQVKPVEGKNSAKPASGKVSFGYAPAGRKGKKA